MTKPDRIADCMRRLGDRYDAAVSRADRDVCGWEHAVMCPVDRNRLREWFEDRMAYLQEEYRLAINEANNIIGKQWLYDNRPKLPR